MNVILFTLIPFFLSLSAISTKTAGNDLFYAIAQRKVGTAQNILASIAEKELPAVLCMTYNVRFLSTQYDALTPLQLLLENYDVLMGDEKRILLQELINKTPPECLFSVTFKQKNTVLHFATKSRTLEENNFKELVGKMVGCRKCGPVGSFSRFLDLRNYINKTAVDFLKHYPRVNNPRAETILLEYRNVFPMLEEIKPTALPETTVPEVDKWQERLEGMDLRVRQYSEFRSLDKPVGNSGSGENKKLFVDNAGKKFIINHSLFGSGEPASLDAYVGILYRFLLGSYTPKMYFVENKNEDGELELFSAMEFDDTFISADQYFFDADWQAKNKLLPTGSGLGEIIAASILLGEIDLKALSGNASNLGVVTHDDKITYFKIDHGQSLQFGQPYSAWLNLEQLAKGLADSEYLRVLGLIDREISLTTKDWDEIVAAAKQFASIPEDKLIQVLDFNEEQLKKLSSYPRKANDLYFKGYVDERFGEDGPLIPNGKNMTTFKEVVLERFRQLRALKL